MKTNHIGKNIILYNKIDSTNDEAKRLADNGAGEGTVVIAKSQSKGRGKPGRSWISQEDKGIYLSIIIEPYILPEKIEVITLLGSLASARAIKGLTSLDIKLKWPNDIVFAQKKLGGVLTEFYKSSENKKIFIVGIGLNIDTEINEFPENLKAITTSISKETGEQINKEKLTKTILEEFEKLYMLLLNKKEEYILDEWKILSDTIGKKVKVSNELSAFEGKATNLGSNGELIIKTFGGRIVKFNSGDIQILGE